MSAVTHAEAYPAVIDHKLRRIRRRRCSLAFGRAVLLTAAALIASMVISMAADRTFTPESASLRLLLTSSALAAAMAMLLVAGKPITASLRLRRTACDVDRAVPELEERWTTVAHFANSHRSPDTTLGKVMLQQVTSEAVAMECLVEPDKVATGTAFGQAMAWLTAATVLLATFFAVAPQHHLVLLKRFWLPLSNVSATQLTSLTGDVTVPRGEPLEIVINTDGVTRPTAMMTIARDGSEDEVAVLEATSDRPRRFAYHLAALDQSFRYRVLSGDGRTGWHSVTAIDRPTLTDLRFTLTAPAYVDRPIYEKEYLPARVQAVQGSHLRLQMRPNVALQNCTLLIKRAGTDDTEPAKEHHVPLAADRDGWYRHELELDENLTLSVVLHSLHGLTNEDRQECRIRVVPDRAPVARVITPKEEMTASPDEVVEVTFEAHDDHGIAKAELVVYMESPLEGEEPAVLSVHDIPLGEQENSQHVIATSNLDLSKLDLNEGANVSFAVRVTDTRMMARSDFSSPDSHSVAAVQRPVDARDEGSTRDDVASTSETPAAHSSGETAERSSSLGRPSDTVAEASQVGQAPAAEQMPEVSTIAEGGKPEPGQGVAESPEGEEPPSSDDKEDAVVDSSLDDPAKQHNSPISDDNAPSSPTARTSPGSPDIDAMPSAAGDPSVALAASQPPNPKVADPAMDNLESTETPAATEQDAGNAAVSDSRASVTSTGAVTGDRASTERPDEGRATQEPPASITDASPPVQPEELAPTNPSFVSGDLRTAARRVTMDDLSGRFTETTRLRLIIEEKQISAAADSAVDREALKIALRKRLEQMDHELKPAEEAIAALVDILSHAGLADPQIEELNDVDARLAKVNRLIADLRTHSEETPYAFVGLHMVEIGAAQISPARDRVYSLIQQPDVDTHANALEASHRISRARELLAELLVRYERVLQEETLAEAMEETAKMYEVYVEDLHRFLRTQSKPNPDPLQRNMAIVEVDQAYLDRLREVTEMRRDLMAEFARMIADDPRLRSKYMDIIKQRQTSLRDRLLELRERQEVIATELHGWRQVDQTQLEDVWMLAAEIRLHDVAPLAQEASQLEERLLAQFPLELEPDDPLSAAVIESGRQVAVGARAAAAKARRLLRDPFDGSISLAPEMDELAYVLSELDAALEELAFDTMDEEIVEYADNRLAESRRLNERVMHWAELAEYLEDRRLHGLAKVDQQQLAWRTELLRIDINSIDERLETQFQEEVPPAIVELANELKLVMEAITFNQAAAVFELESERLDEGQAQQAYAVEKFKQAEDLFEQMRRQVVEQLDRNNPPDPNIADLEDPTLDQILLQLEREQNLAAVLGLPDRPRNLRVISDFFAAAGGDMKVPMALNQAAAQARQRAGDEAEEARKMRRGSDEDDLTEEQWRDIQDAEEAQEKLAEKINELQRQADDPEADPDSAATLRQLAEQLDQMRQELANRQPQERQWQEMVRSDQMRAILRAAASGEPLPESRWNRLMSSLDDGLWQVRRDTPPEEYRQAIEQYQERLRKLLSLETPDAQR